jgi:DNA-binding GntR family transcriptional regulator
MLSIRQANFDIAHRSRKWFNRCMGGRATERRSTRTQQVYAQLRDDILAGRLTPGSRLPFAELGARYDSSMSAIREGLQRLVEQGLVVSEPQLGFRVATLSIDDLQDLTTARCEIEGLALRYSIEHGDLAWEAGVVAAWHTLERTPLGAADADGVEALAREWTTAHSAFHTALIAGCPNRRILAAASALRDGAELYRHWSWRTAGVDRDVVAEHQAQVEAALARDADLAVRLLHEHLVTTTHLLVVANQRSPHEGEVT